MGISNKRHADAILDAAIIDVNAVLSETLKHLIKMSIADIEQHIALTCNKALAQNEKIINATNRFSKFPKSVLVRQHVVMARLIERLELIQVRFKDNKDAKGLLKVVEINLPHIKEGGAKDG